MMHLLLEPQRVERSVLSVACGATTGAYLIQISDQRKRTCLLFNSINSITSITSSADTC